MMVKPLESLRESKRAHESPVTKIPIDGLGKQGTIKNKLSKCSNNGFYITSLLFFMISDNEVGLMWVFFVIGKS